MPDIPLGTREDVRVGLDALNQGNLEGARKHFIALLEENPRLAPAHLALGRVFAAEGDYRKALDCEEALAIQPSLRPAQLFAAGEHEFLGDVDDALAG
jgi:tetratricopeptide (TPR) repeat protein